MGIDVSNLKKITIVTGHYGSGKTNIAVNLAISLQQAGRRVTVVDLDIVNPYFRTTDHGELFKSLSIELVSPTYANTNLDIPALTGQVDVMLYDTDPNHYFIVDVGGDDAGAIALGRYANQLLALDYDMLYVINCYRYLTQNSEEALELLREIEQVSRLKVTKLVNNSNLGQLTTESDVTKSIHFAEQTAKLAGVSVAYTTIDKEISSNYDGVTIYVKKSWE